MSLLQKEHGWNMVYKAGFDMKAYKKIPPRMERGDTVKCHLHFSWKQLEDTFGLKVKSYDTNN
jgi:hypothetical protein